MFSERIAVAVPPAVPSDTAEEVIRNAAVGLIRTFDGPRGKIAAILIAEGQSEPAIIRQWFDEYIRHRRAANAADIERGKASGELVAEADPELLIDAVFGAIWYRLLFRSAPLTE